MGLEGEHHTQALWLADVWEGDHLLEVACFTTRRRLGLAWAWFRGDDKQADLYVRVIK